MAKKSWKQLKEILHLFKRHRWTGGGATGGSSCSHRLHSEPPLQKTVACSTSQKYFSESYKEFLRLYSNIKVYRSKFLLLSKLSMSKLSQSKPWDTCKLWMTLKQASDCYLRVWHLASLNKFRIWEFRWHDYQWVATVSVCFTFIGHGYMGWVFLLDNHKQGLWRQDFAFFIFKGAGLVRAEIQRNKNEASVYRKGNVHGRTRSLRSIYG